MTTEAEATRRSLHERLVALATVATGLQAAARYPPIAPTDWRGPASEAYDSLEAMLRLRLVAAERTASAAERSIRIAIGELGG